MPFVPVRFRLTVIAALLAGVGVIGLCGVGASGAAMRGATAAAGPPKTVTGVKITRRRGTLAPGTRVPASEIFGQRVFTDANHGFALASPAEADYPVATTDGGRTWRTDGPALHLHAANAPAAVVYIGAVSRKTIFAWGGGQVIDTTGDGGKTWYSTLFNGGPVAVVPVLTGGLDAFVGSNNGAQIWQYISKDGGRTWRYQTTVGQ